MMKILKNNILSYLSRLLAVALGVLGFSSCGGNSHWGIAVDYGCPAADYDISGRVVNDADEPIEGVEVHLLDMWSQKTGTNDTTNAEGEYALQSTAYPMDSISIVAVDVDGEANGLYASDTVRVKTEFVGGTDWYYSGKYTGVVNFKLKTVEPLTPEENEE